MALIKCPECQKEVSDKATVCVHCGYPIKEWLKSEQKKSSSKKYNAMVKHLETEYLS